MAKKRMSAAKREALVLRLLRSEDLVTVSRQAGVSLHRLSKWREMSARGELLPMSGEAEAGNAGDRPAEEYPGRAKTDVCRVSLNQAPLRLRKSIRICPLCLVNSGVRGRAPVGPKAR